MKQINKIKVQPKECENCGALWRVMRDGRIDFMPRSPAMHHVCRDCMEEALKDSKAAEKAFKAAKVKAEKAAKAEEKQKDDADS